MFSQSVCLWAHRMLIKRLAYARINMNGVALDIVELCKDFLLFNSWIYIWISWTNSNRSLVYFYVEFLEIRLMKLLSGFCCATGYLYFRQLCSSTVIFSLCNCCLSNWVYLELSDYFKTNVKCQSTLQRVSILPTALQLHLLIIC